MEVGDEGASTTATVTAIEMQARGRGRAKKQDRPSDVYGLDEKTFVERKIKSGDTLNAIAIKYACHVSDLKRANNLHSDQDFLALSVVKIPMSRLRHALRLGIESQSEDEEEEEVDDRRALLHATQSREPSADEIFNKTDAAIAQVRESLPANATDIGFHFVDARPPDSGNRQIWMVIIGVVLIFVILPVVLTVWEEEEEAAHHHHNSTA